MRRYASTAYWWQNQCAVVRVARNIEIGLRFNLDGLRINAAWYYADPEQIALFRAAVAADESERALEGLVRSLEADGHEILGDVMKRTPRGYLAGHPRADLLRHRSLIAARELESDSVRDVEPVYSSCERLRPLLEWLAGHVVAPQGPRPAGLQRGSCAVSVRTLDRRFVPCGDLPAVQASATCYAPNDQVCVRRGCL